MSIHWRQSRVSLPSWDDMRDNETGHSTGDNQTVTNEVSALISQDSQVTSSVDDKLSSKHYQMFDSNSYNKKLEFHTSPPLQQ